jgi:hypothetical protein
MAWKKARKAGAALLGCEERKPERPTQQSNGEDFNLRGKTTMASWLQKGLEGKGGLRKGHG